VIRLDTLSTETEPWALAVIMRPEHTMFVPTELGRVLITGASGSIGSLIQLELEGIAEEVFATDIDTLDVRDHYLINRFFRNVQPDLVLHLAGAKHAPEGEVDPYGVMVTNTIGTFNVLEAANNHGIRVVVASTCKAVEPATAYGASKLVAERMALNAGAVVARYFNVIETSGNVFDIWRQFPENMPLPVAKQCSRRFITAKEAVSLTLWCCTVKSGRYIVNHTWTRSMGMVAESLYPERVMVEIKPRRGDRLVEPEIATHETKIPVIHNVAKVVSPHD